METLNILLLACVCIIIAYTISHKTTDLEKLNRLKRIVNSINVVDPKIETLDFHLDPAESYILDKRDVYVCVEDDITDNFLVYIVLHEVAHSLIQEDTSHHPPAFLDTFKSLLNKAEALKLYNSNHTIPSKYCDTTCKGVLK
jgi:hypothetical protein